MTPYELNDSYVSRESLLMTALVMYLTLMSGFLVAIYVVGRKLTKFQLVALCVTYYAWAITHLSAIKTYGLEIIVLRIKIQEISPENVVLIGGTHLNLAVAAVVFLATLVFPGVFAWQIRRGTGHGL